MGLFHSQIHSASILKVHIALWWDNMRTNQTTKIVPDYICLGKQGFECAVCHLKPQDQDTVKCWWEVFSDWCGNDGWQQSYYE